jgi:hypothetical protein
MKLYKPLILVSFFCLAYLGGCKGILDGYMSPTGGTKVPDYPYFITTKPLIVKKILVPTGTTLVYEVHLLKNGKQGDLMSEDKLKEIKLTGIGTIYWGGVPITSIYKFFNPEMRGFTVYANFEQLSKDKISKFSELWQKCSDNLKISIKNSDDWSFNTKNISDIESCDVNYSRFSKLKERQMFLDEMYAELLKIDSN